MPRFKIALATALVAGCSVACAGDFVPRAASTGLVAIADDSSSHSASTAALSETDSCPTADSAPAVPAHASTPPRIAPRVGVDDVAVERAVTASAPQASDDEKPGPQPVARKPHALRWQSLLPGVMK